MNLIKEFAEALVELRRTDAGVWQVTVRALPGSNPLPICTTTVEARAQEWRRCAVRTLEAVAREVLLKDWAETVEPGETTT